jgi:hypothetical protein
VVVYFNSGVSVASKHSLQFSDSSVDALTHQHGVSEISAPFAGFNPAEYEIDGPNGRMKMLNPANAIEFRLPASANVSAFMEAMRNRPGVGLVFEDTPPVPQVDPPNDPSFSTQWNLTDSKYGLGLLEAWEYTTGSSSMVVSLLDAGIHVSSPGADLVGRFLSGSNDVPNSNLWVYNGIKHGYAVAGVLAANVDNGVAIAGVDAETKLFSRNFIYHTWDQRIWDIIHSLQVGAQVFNLSYIWPDEQNLDYLSMYYLGYAYRPNSLLVASMGNADLSTPASPSRESFTLSIGGHDQSGDHYGRYGDMVDLSAPAVNVPTIDDKSSTVILSGTSLAAGQASGVANLLWSQYPTLDADDIANIMKVSAVSRPDENEFGEGTLNARRAFELVDNATELRHVQGPGINAFVRSHDGPRVPILMVDENALGEVTVFPGYAEVDTHRAELLFNKTYSEPPMVWGRGAYSAGRSLDNPNFSTGYTGIKYVTEHRAGVISYRYVVYDSPTSGQTWFATPWPTIYAISVLEKPAPFPPNLVGITGSGGHPYIYWDAAKEKDCA